MGLTGDTASTRGSERVLFNGLDDRQTDLMATLRDHGTYFWLDLHVDDTRLRDGLAREWLNREPLRVPEHALTVLFAESASPRAKYHADGEHVVFAFHWVGDP